MQSLTRNLGREIAGGVAAYLAGLGLVAWDQFDAPGHAYTRNTVWPTFLGPESPTSPDAIVTITPGVMSFVRSDVTASIQVRLRGKQDAGPDAVGLKAQQIHDAFNPNGFPLVHVTLGTIRAGVVLPGNMLPLEPDKNRRHGMIQNFTIRTRRTGGN